MEQMMACLLAEIRINRKRKEDKLGAEIKTTRGNMDANQDMIEKTKRR
jgi:hypothetical protein